MTARRAHPTVTEPPTEPPTSMHNALARALAAREEAGLDVCGDAGDRPSKGRPRSAAAHAAILTATLDLLATGGYDQTSIEAIAQRAKVGKATVYRRWPSKAELVIEVLETIASAADTPDTGDTRTDLRTFVDNIVRGFTETEYGEILSGLAAEIARNPSLAEIFRESFLRPRRRAAQRIVERGIERGDIREGVDVDLVLDLMVAPLYYRNMLSGMPITAATADALVAYVLDGVAAPASSPRRRG